MNSGRLTVWIGGREALPVRAIPYVDGWLRFSPDAVARYLAQDDDLFTEWDTPLIAHRQTDGAPIAAVPPREWDGVAASLAGFAEETGDGDAGYAIWRKHAVEKLPASVFVWLDEFEAAHKSRCARLLLVPTRSGDDELTLSPVLLDGGVVAMVLDGFADKAQLAELPADSGGEGDAAKVSVGETAKAKGGRKPGPARELLRRILDELEKWAAAADEPFDRWRMPGPLGKKADDANSFHWLCAQIAPLVFTKAPTTFEKHRAGLCAIVEYAKPSDFYRRALPHIAPKIAGGNNVSKIPVKRRKAT